MALICPLLTYTHEGQRNDPREGHSSQKSAEDPHSQEVCWRSCCFVILKLCSHLLLILTDDVFAAPSITHRYYLLIRQFERPISVHPQPIVSGSFQLLMCHHKWTQIPAIAQSSWKYAILCSWFLTMMCMQLLQWPITHRFYLLLIG